MDKGPSLAEQMQLGMDVRIDRRDFIAGSLAATCPLAGCAAHEDQPDSWTGYGGEGDYALSNGNTLNVRNAAHNLRDGLYGKLDDFSETSEHHDIVIVGGGLAGLSAARTVQTEGHASCLVLENHPIFGGEAKENEFNVDGYRLVAPQGSNDFVVPKAGSGEHANLWRNLGIPEEFKFAEPNGLQSSMRIGREHFVPMYWNLNAASVGYFFRSGNKLVRDMWQNDFAGAPLPAEVKSDFRRWRSEPAPVAPQGNVDHWLDSMTYGHLLTNVLGLRREILDYVDPIVATGSFGVSADAVSAYGAYQLRLPGTCDLPHQQPLPDADQTYFSFPGGNSAIARYLVKRLLPDAIEGQDTFESIIGAGINFPALDQPGNSVRIRLGAMVVGVQHSADQRTVDIFYVKDGRKARLQAKAVVMANGAWVAKHVVRDLPDRNRAALDQFLFAPILVVNIALRSWRFLDQLGISAARWFEGFGFFASIRRPMLVGSRTPPFEPDKPTVLTMYVGFPQGGKSAAQQTSEGRQRLLNTDFAGFEFEVRRQLSELFARAGFDARRDIAGIVLNRWGHAYVAPQPGFYFGTQAAPAPSAVASERFGRISFGHSQLRGHQNWVGAVTEGARAAREALAMI